MKQRDVFLQSEGDAWNRRNEQVVANRRLPEDDPLLQELIPVLELGGVGDVLEIGSGVGSRLAWIQEEYDVRCHGIDPSAQAVARAVDAGVDARVGTAESLPFPDNSVDIAIFGFCLYLCDREDLFRIASETDRVLRTPGWLLILDFYSPVPTARPYHHRSGVQSYKMDYRGLFSWHPYYHCLTHKVRRHGSGSGYVDDPSEWIGVSVLRKSREIVP